MAEQKQHKPTERKIKKARKEGTVLKGPLITQITALLAALLSVGIVVKYSWEKNVLLLQYGFEDFSKINTLYLKQWLSVSMTYTLVVLCTIVAISVFIEFLQVGLKFEFSLISMKGNRMNPASGVKKISSGLKNIWETVARLLLLLPIVIFLISSHIHQVGNVYLSGAIGDYFITWSSLFVFLIVMLTALFLSASLEFMIKRKVFYRDLSMSQDELQREFKDDEGDPQMKEARKSLHMSIMNQDVIKRIRKSKVIVVKKNV